MPYLNVPEAVAICPYCGSGLCVEPQEWEVETGRIVSIVAWCSADLDAFDQSHIDEDAEYDDTSHPCGYDPDWMDATLKAEAWAQTQKMPDSEPAAEEKS